MEFIDKLFGSKETKNKSQSIIDTVPVLRIEDGLIILKDGRAAMGFEFIGSPFETMIAEDYQTFGKTFEAATLTLPENYIIQKIDRYANAYYPKGRDEDGFGKKEFFEKETIIHFSTRPVLRQISYVFVISNNNLNKKNNSLTTSVSRGSRILSSDLNGLEKRIELLEINGKSFMETLISTNYVKAIRLNDVDLRNLYYQFLNLEFSHEVREPYKEILNLYNAISVGEKRLNIISLEEQGTEIYYSVPNDYGIDSCFTWRLGINLQFPHITITSFYIEDSKSVIKSLENKKMITANTGLLGGEEAKQKADQLRIYIEESTRALVKFISTSLQVLVYTLSDAAREKNVQATADALRATYGLKPLVETFEGINLFFSCMPGASGYLNRWVLTESAHAACYINPMAEFFSRKDGDYIADRFRNLVYIDLFNPDLDNKNAIIVGPSGSGKSYTVGHFKLQRYERKERQIVLDVGGTYRNIFQALGSDDPKSDVRYYEYSPEKPIKFNPFYCLYNEEKQEYDITEDKISFIITLLALLNKPKGDTWNNQEWSILQKLLPQYYLELAKTSKEKGSGFIVPNLIGFSDWLAEYTKRNKGNETFVKMIERFDIYGFQLTLEPFVSGKYKGLLNSTDTLDISDYRLVCFDMARVKDDERLYPIVSLLLMELTMDVLRKFPNDKKYFIMDEAWSMLTEGMGAFVEYLFRTIRKNNGSAGIITQGIDELNTKIGNSIKQQCETQIILNHKNDEAIEKVGAFFGFTQSEIKLVRSIRVNRECREVFFKQGRSSFVAVLEVPPVEHAILTSNPVERNHLNKLKMFYENNIQYAINQFVEDKENGISK
ncbi:MAG: VirB4 family type IV secretion system protein [Bacteroidia bacterium]